MSDNLAAFSAFMEAERMRLIAAARRARVLDHDTNRGSDYERAILAWVREFVEPEYAVVGGEIVDTFNTNRGEDRRQLDAIVHKNTRHARRYSFGNELRLVPVESVALTLEIKLSIDLKGFKTADQSAATTNKLRLAVDRITRPMLEDSRWPENWLEKAETLVRGLARWVADAYKRVWFGIIAADGPRVETLAKWLRTGSTIDFICCLSSGCAFRHPFARRSKAGATSFTDVAPADRSLTHLATVLQIALNNFESHDKDQAPAWGNYHPYMAVRYYDATGFMGPQGTKRLPEEDAELLRMRAAEEEQTLIAYALATERAKASRPRKR